MGVRSTSFLIDQLLAYWRGRTPNFGGLSETIVPVVQVDRFRDDAEGSIYFGGIDTTTLGKSSNESWSFAFGIPKARRTDLFVHSVYVYDIPGTPNRFDEFALVLPGGWAGTIFGGLGTPPVLKGPFFSASSSKYDNTVSSAFLWAGATPNLGGAAHFLGASPLILPARSLSGGSSAMARWEKHFEPPLRIYCGDALLGISLEAPFTPSGERMQFSFVWHERPTVFPNKVSLVPNGIPGLEPG